MYTDTLPAEIPASEFRGYRIVDVRQPGRIVNDIFVYDANTPEKAAKHALGIDLVRSGKPRDLQARVYFQDAGGLTMVRLYQRVSER